MDVLREMGDAGRTVLFSSHILEEVEQLATTIEVMVSGRHAASGDFRAIRRLMTQRPHRYVVRSSADRALAAAVVGEDGTSAVELVGAELHVQVTDVARFSRVIVQAASSAGIRLHEVRPADESLESVFSYLVGHR
jgi:ABC-2 type transport system ATP-binding protein